MIRNTKQDSIPRTKRKWMLSRIVVTKYFMFYVLNWLTGTAEKEPYLIKKHLYLHTYPFPIIVLMILSRQHRNRVRTRRDNILRLPIYSFISYFTVITQNCKDFMFWWNVFLCCYYTHSKHQPFRGGSQTKRHSPSQ